MERRVSVSSLREADTGFQHTLSILLYVSGSRYIAASPAVHAGCRVPCRACRPGGITAAQVAREMASGKAYVHSSPDVYGRPVIVIRVQRHVTGDAHFKLQCTAFIWLWMWLVCACRLWVVHSLL